MRLLLDHCVDRRVAPLLVGHEVTTAAEKQWGELRNGELLAAAADDGFEAVVTTDRNIRYQQNLERLPIAVVVLKAKTNRVSDLAVLIPLVESALRSLAPRTVIEVGVGTEPGE